MSAMCINRSQASFLDLFVSAFAQLKAAWKTPDKYPEFVFAISIA